MLGGPRNRVDRDFWSAYFSVEYKDVAAFSILVVVLIFMPTGVLVVRKSRKSDGD